MVSITATDDWRKTWHGAAIGLLELTNVDNHAHIQTLEQRKREIESRLKARYAGFTRQEFSSLPVMSDYIRYYKRFEKTYHVLLQVESLAIKGKSLPSVSPLVDANFMVEVDTLILTAGHDADKLKGEVLMDVARQGEQFEQMGGSLKTIPAGDMIMRDELGICCSILYGQDNRSPITAETSHVLYVSYVPVGIHIEAVERHLAQIIETVQLFSPNAVVEQNRLITA